MKSARGQFPGSHGLLLAIPAAIPDNKGTCSAREAGIRRTRGTGVETRRAEKVPPAMERSGATASGTGALNQQMMFQRLRWWLLRNSGATVLQGSWIRVLSVL